MSGKAYVAFRSPVEINSYFKNVNKTYKSIGLAFVTGFDQFCQQNPESFRLVLTRTTTLNFERGDSADWTEKTPSRIAAMAEGTPRLIKDERQDLYLKEFEENKKVSIKLLNQKERLPIFAHRNEILQKIRENQVVLIKGETGSGKTTQGNIFQIKSKPLQNNETFFFSTTIHT